MRSPSLRVLSIATGVLILACLSEAPVETGATPPTNQEWDREGRRAELVQLHAHGLSNHNEPEAGSMEYMTKEALKYGYRVMWWSDHTEIFALPDQAYHFRGATLSGADQVRFPATINPKWYATHFGVSTHNATDSLALVDDTLSIAATAADTNASIVVALQSDGYLGIVHAFEFARPLFSNVSFCLPIGMTGAAAMTAVQVDIRLAYHSKGTSGRFNALRYVLTDSLQPARYLLTDSSDVTVLTLAKPATTITQYCFPLTADARTEGGVDNTASGFSVTLINPSVGTVLRLGPVSIHSVVSDPSANWPLIKRIADSLQVARGLVQYLGAEYITNQNHVNGFISDQSPTAASVFVPRAGLAAFVTRVHAAGGIASLNHPFGVNDLLDASTQDARIPVVRDSILALGAYGADLLEVGYPKRGGVDLRTHLRLWDELSLRGMRLCGIGTGDSHGGPWGEGMRVGPFGTWVWAEDLTSETLIRQLRSCRAFFGVPHRWRGEVELLAEPLSLPDSTDMASWRGKVARMGEHNLPPGRWQVRFIMTPAMPGSTATLIRAHYSAGFPTNYQIRTVLSGESVTIDLSKGDLVRVEVFGPDKEAIVFTNPIWVRYGT